MSALELVTWALVAVFPLTEAVLVVRTRSARRGGESRDRGTIRVLWAAIGTAVLGAFLASRVAFARLPVSPACAAAIALLVAGLAVRWWAIVTLGRFFTVDVAVHDDHVLVESGPYRWVRHPSYTGTLLAFAGVGFAFASWLSPLVVLAIVGPAFAWRIRQEERALRARLGAAYARYAARTGALWPRLVRARGRDARVDPGPARPRSDQGQSPGAGG